MDSGELAGTVTVVTGPPGAGKSTISRSLAARLDLAVLVCGDDVLGCVVSGFIEPWHPESDHQNRTAVAATAATAREYARAGFPVIVDAVLGPWHLDVFLTTLDLPCRYIVVRPDLETTVDRATSRGPGSLTDEEPVRFMWDAFTDLGELERHVIDTTRLSIDATVDAIATAGPETLLGRPAI